MIVRREAFAGALAATTADDTRYFLNAVQVRQNGDVAATDGHVAFIVHDNRPMETADFPTVPGADIHGEPAQDVLVPFDTAKRLIGATAKGKRALPILAGIHVGRNGAEGVTVLAATDLAVPAVATIQHDPNGARFPELDRVVPAADTARVRVSLAVPVLEAIIKAAKAVSGSKRLQTITLQIPEADKQNAIVSALRLEIAGDDLTITGAVMPCRV
jgi:hypothetical protein